MVEVELLGLLLSADFIVGLAVRTVISGLLLFVLSRFVGAKGGILAAMGVAFFTTLITMFVFEAYIFQLLEFGGEDVVQSIEKNVFGLILSYILPGIVWFFLVMILMKVGPVRAGIVALLQWLLSLALSYFGVLVFLTEFL